MRILLILGLAGALALPAAAEDAAPTDVAGDWVLIASFRGDDIESRLQLRRDEAGVLSGTYTTADGRETKLAGLGFEKGTLKFERTMGPRRIPFEARVEGNRLTGAHKLGPRRIQTWGARGKDAIAALRAERKQATRRESDIEADYDKRARRAVPRDGFPVLFDPTLTPAGEAKGLRDDEPVIGVEIGGEARAYPVAIMGIHELVNDTCHGEPIAASW